MATFPYCYAPPSWSEYKLGNGGEGDGAAASATGASAASGSAAAAAAGAAAAAAAAAAPPEMGGGGEALRVEYAAEHGSKTSEELSLLAHWDAACLSWRMLEARGSARRFAHTLTFEGLRSALFDLADAHLTRAKADVLRPFTGDVASKLQDYMDFAYRLTEACLVPADDNGAGSTGASGGGSAATNEPDKPTRNPPPPASERPKHAWPAYDAHFVETIRKHALLRAGVREHQGGNVSLEGAAREFRNLCRLVLAFGKSARRGACAWKGFVSLNPLTSLSLPSYPALPTLLPHSPYPLPTLSHPLPPLPFPFA